MPIRQIITFRTQTGEGAAFAEGFRPIIEKVRGSDGCLQYEMFRSVADPDVLVMLERWRDQDAIQAALVRHNPGPDHPSLAFFSKLSGPPHREQLEVS